MMSRYDARIKAVRRMPRDYGDGTRVNMWSRYSMPAGES